MNATGGAVWGIGVDGARWVVEEACRGGVDVQLVRHGAGGAEVVELAGGADLPVEVAYGEVQQRPGCAGPVSTVALLDEGGAPCGWLAARREAGQPEPGLWRVLLLAALARELDR